MVFPKGRIEGVKANFLGAPPIPACLLRSVGHCRKYAGKDGRRSQEKRDMKTPQRVESSSLEEGLHAPDSMRSFVAQEALGRKTPLRGMLTI